MPFKGYKQEFSKIQANHTTRLEREELLRGSGISMSSGLSRRDMYLKESAHLHGYEFISKFLTNRISHICLLFFIYCRSHGLVNDQISIAMDTKEHLLSQRQQFKRFQTRLNDMSNRFPLISR